MPVNSGTTSEPYTPASGRAVSSSTFASGGPRAGPPGTLNELFFEAARKYDKPDALQFKKDGAYVPISHRTLTDRVRRVAIALRDLGVQRKDRVAILSENRPEWAIADYACLTAGLTDVPVYPTLPADQITHILRDSGAVAIFVSNAEQAAKIAQIRGELPGLKHVVSFVPGLAGADMSLADLERKGEGADTPERRAAYEKEARDVQPDDLATLIYTSGTTGLPKGVMLTHDNIFSNVQAAATAVPFEGGSDIGLSFLPLSHIFERMAGHYLMFHGGCSIAYAESIDTVPVNLAEVRPTLMCAVPRLYEKMYARVLENALSGSFIKQKIFFWARAVADRWADEKLAGREPKGFLAFRYGIAQKLVFSKLKARTGGRLRYFVSGGAPLAAEINKFFYAAGLTVLEGYGLTETSPVIAVNTPEAIRMGTVGRPVKGVDVQIASDGEILTKGPHVMQGYFNNPEATREAIDADGWFHTGDIGVLEDGFVRITDRKKDIIVTAGGKNIAPQPLENRVRTNKYVSQAVMIGDKRKYPVMLVVPNWENLEKWARQKNILWTDRRQLLEMPTVRAKVEKEVYEQLEGCAKYELPKKIGLILEEFSIERGELTPKLSVKRKVVDQNYRALVDSLYVDGGQSD